MGIYTRNRTPYERRTLQDMLVPYLMYTQRYDDIANKFGELGDLSVIWNNLLSPTKDPETWNTVNDYNMRLGDVINNMQRGNMDLNTAMNELQNMRREYNSWGVAVDAAYKQKLKFIEELRALSLQPGGFHFTRPAESISIDELMENPAASYEALSENELYTRGLNASKASSDRRFSLYEATRFKNEYNMLVTQKGYSQADAARFLANKYSIPELGKIFDNLSLEYNLDRFGNNDNIDRFQLDLSIINGILDGMTGSRTEAMLGKREEYVDPFAVNNKGNKSNNSGTSSLPRIPLSHITQGTNEPTKNIVDDVAFMDNRRVMTTSSVKDWGEFNTFASEYEQMQKEYKEAILNGKKEIKHKGVDESFPEYSEYQNISDIVYDENGNLKPGVWWVYNGKRYSTNDLIKAKEKYDELSAPLNDANLVYDKYDYLSSTSGLNTNLTQADVINLGNQLNNTTALLKIVLYPYKNKPSNSKNIISYYNAILSKHHDGSQNGIFKINDDGSLGDALSNQLATNDNAVVVAKDSKYGLQIGFIQNGLEYAWKGDAIIDEITKEYDGIKNWLLDFTSVGVGLKSSLYAVNLVQKHFPSSNIFELQPIKIVNTEQSPYGLDEIYLSINGKNGVKIPGTPYYGFVVYDQATQDIVKIVSDTLKFILPNAQLDPETGRYYRSYGSNIIAINTMSSQLRGDRGYMEHYLEEFLQESFDELDSGINQNE